METRQLLIVTPVPSAPPDKGFRFALQEFFQYHSFVMKINLAPLRVYTKSPPPQRRMPGSSRQRLEAQRRCTRRRRRTLERQKRWLERRKQCPKQELWKQASEDD